MPDEITVIETSTETTGEGAGETPVPESTESTESTESGSGETVGGTGETKKRRGPFYTFDKVTDDIKTGVKNARKPGPFNDYISKYGYKEARLDEGESLIVEAETARTDQLNALALKNQKYREAEDSWRAAKLAYKPHRVIGKEAFKGNFHLLDKLGFSIRLQEPFGAWKGQSMQLYNNTDAPGVLEGFALYNITPEALAAGKQTVLDAEAARAERKLAKANAEKATEVKMKAYKKLLAWWRNFIKVVEVALQEDPQLKEQVHIVVPSL
ncbi:MAG: hypothetical protein GY940_48175 [bacterium]|nr:hypothetical protein [bacterium]